MTKNSQFEIALDCLRYAQDQQTLKDYKLFCERSVGPGTAYDDRMRIYARLLQDGLVEIDSNRLRLGSLVDTEWLREGLVDGAPVAWAITALFGRRYRKFDPDNSIREEIGLRGELAVISEIEKSVPPALSQKIVHVALVDSSAGYDVYAPSVSGANQAFLLEVKTSTRPGHDFHFYLTRNELETARKNANWRLVFVRIRNGAPKILGSLGFWEIEPVLPSENDSRARWLQLEVTLDPELFTPQLP
jgi:hypothetical protein